MTLFLRFRPFLSTAAPILAKKRFSGPHQRGRGWKFELCVYITISDITLETGDIVGSSALEDNSN